ncbi:MAG: hypothetical protein FWC91_12295, partial [Defluviitaleaceae bacterium]|nr:hypothetical protein [Defluviitaleaceae bacterium]
TVAGCLATIRKSGVLRKPHAIGVAVVGSGRDFWPGPTICKTRLLRKGGPAGRPLVAKCPTAV